MTIYDISETARKNRADRLAAMRQAGNEGAADAAKYLALLIVAAGGLALFRFIF